MKIEHLACCQTRSAFGIASIKFTDFTNTTPKNINSWSHWVESVWE